MTKWCPGCEQHLEKAEFYKDRCRHDGLASRCKKCDKAYRLRAVERDPTLVRKYMVKSQFNLDWPDYQLLLSIQEHRCAACRDPFKATPHVDHDHSCCPGQRSCGRCIRGLLCQGCNVAAGALKDDPQVIRKLATYIERS